MKLAQQSVINKFSLNFNYHFIDQQFSTYEMLFKKFLSMIFIIIVS